MDKNMNMDILLITRNQTVFFFFQTFQIFETRSFFFLQQWQFKKKYEQMNSS